MKYRNIPGLVLPFFLILALIVVSGCVQDSGDISTGNETSEDMNIAQEQGPGFGPAGNQSPPMKPGPGAGPSFKAGYYDNNMTGNLTQELSLIPVGELTETEKSTILYMTEEEKLARDTYLMYYDIWGRSVFLNIAGSEQWHIDAMELLIDRYGLEDPINERRGIFTNTAIQNMYDKFVSSGSQSVEQALNNSIYIEETDISDLKEAIAGTDKPDLRLVYNNLLSASEKHLESFLLNNELTDIRNYMGPGPVMVPPEGMNDTVGNITG